MAIPSTPTSFVADSLARPWFQGLAGGSANYDAVKLTWVHAGAWIRLQIFQGGVWADVAQGSQTASYLCRSLTSVSAEIIGIIGGAQFRVAAGNSEGQSAWSPGVVVTASSGSVVLASLVAPVATLGANSTSSVSITWTDSQAQESFFELELRNVLTGAVRTYAQSTFVRTFSRAPGADGVLATTPYVARVRAVSEQAAGARINGPWSNDLVFTTLAPVIILTQLPAAVDWWRNAPSGSYTLVTNTPPTSTSTGTLPTGLTHASGIITGVAAAPVGAYNVNVTATNSAGSDTKVLTINVREPSISLQFSRPGGVPVDATTANQTQLGKGPLAVLFDLVVRAVVNGPVSSAFTSLTISGAPAWLTIIGSSLKGTPNVPGLWDVNVTGTNATAQTSSAVIRIEVPTLAFTSASRLNVFEQDVISFLVTTSPAAGEVILSGAPEWLALVAGELTGIAPAPGHFTPTLTATLGGSSAVQAFELAVQSVISAPAEIVGHVGDPLIDAATYLGAATVEAWHMSHLPEGVTFSELPIGAGNAALSINGTPTEFGIFESVISAQVRTAADVRMVRRTVIFRISGGLFLHWFHDHPQRRELQVLMRTGEVRSASETATATLALKRGDGRRVHVIFRDGPFGPGRIGRDVVTDDFSALALTIRPAGDFDSEPYITLENVATTEDIDGNTIAYFEIPATTEAIEVAFNSLNSSPLANPAAAALAATGELTWTRAGAKDSSELFTVAIHQDIDR